MVARGSTLSVSSMGSRKDIHKTLFLFWLFHRNILSHFDISCQLLRQQLCLHLPLRLIFKKSLLSFWYLTIALAVREKEYVWTSPLVLLPVESCAIHLCQPLYQLGPLCVYIKLIDEQFIRLMDSAGPDKHLATRSVFKKTTKIFCCLTPAASAL